MNKHLNVDKYSKISQRFYQKDSIPLLSTRLNALIIAKLL